ncbi:MAG: NAD(P)/FAD-dependent oxidoreductase [candidate division Zixibacteria bacterium]|nr:NAD(P)/FAD-dependent oxidoreductase [candidate division Zixibacteria bacterium]
MDIEPVIIIGGGPAGIAAAIQLARYGVRPIIFEKEKLGGLLRNANLVENYPGFPGGISGIELAALFEQQLSEHEVRVLGEEVVALDYDNRSFLVTSDRRLYRSQIAVIASGTRAKRLRDIDIPENARDRVFYEVVPLLGMTDKKIVVVGAGDAAFDYTLTLGRENDITLLNRSREAKCLPLLRQRLQKLARVSYHTNAQITSIQHDMSGKLAVEVNSHNEVLQLEADYLIFAIGREPSCDFLSARLQEKSDELKNEGLLYFIGDVKNGNLRQTSIAVGDGVKAAMRIAEKLGDQS